MVDHLFAMAPVALAWSEMMPNGQSADGCFSGGIYRTFRHKKGTGEVQDFSGSLNNAGFHYARASAVDLRQMRAPVVSPCAKATNDHYLATPVDGGSNNAWKLH